eukprot:TRINITY_DN15001_c2_g1_i3.p1 TRINITY_DN15001_c2_g1~~TRINITY_DN15001_c2_g1_i3.p1  ORF type:complete len:282 (-),score=67.62 TRINITY_DN15001_c2_g1_i3:70-915(-)
MIPREHDASESEHRERAQPVHVGAGLMQGLSKFGEHVSHGSTRLVRRTREGHETGGTLGAVKGAAVGSVILTSSLGKGACDLLGRTLEGVRHTPDVVADKVVKDRQHKKHGVDGEGEGEILQSYVEENEPAHIGEGLITGARGLGRGFVAGLKDLAVKPVEGAKDNGTKGFAQGLGLGALGFVTKASAGTLDFAINLADGAKNTPGKIDSYIKKRQGVEKAPDASAAEDDFSDFGTPLEYVKRSSSSRSSPPEENFARDGLPGSDPNSRNSQEPEEPAFEL